MLALLQQVHLAGVGHAAPCLRALQCVPLPMQLPLPRATATTTLRTPD